jgi:hypothetical protein
MSTSSSRPRRALLRLESLEDRRLMAFDPSPLEQEMLEHLNRMRMNPQGELDVLFSSHPEPLVARDADVQNAITYFNVSGSLLESQWATLSAAPPVAWNEALHTAATTHNQLMIEYDQQSHQLPGEPSLLTRMVDAGYNWSGSVGAGENVFAFADSVLYAHAGFAIDWGFGTGGIQSGVGHRVNMMNATFQEVGIAVTAENNSSTDVGPLVVTQDFGRRGNYGHANLLGVVYVDTNGDGRYQAGEQRGGVQLTITGANGTLITSSMSAGGYQIQLAPGTYTVTASGGGMTQPMVVPNVIVGNTNVKVDFRVPTVTQPPTTGPADKIGVHRGVSFFRDVNNNSVWDSATDQVSSFGATGDTALVGDWNGDGRDDIGVWRRALFYFDFNGDGVWSSGDRQVGFGLTTDRPLVGDWDGDGQDQIGVWRNGTFYLDLNGNLIWDSGDRTFRFGLSSDAPLVGDWDGDGRDQVGVKRNTIYYLDLDGNHAWNSGDVQFGFGLASDTPLVGDWLGDGRDQIGVWRSGTFYLDLNNSRSWNTGDVSFRFGLSTDRPIVGQWSDVSTTSTNGPSIQTGASIAPQSYSLASTDQAPHLASLAAAVDSYFAADRNRRGTEWTDLDSLQRAS